MTDSMVFLIGVSLIVLHEMDAIRCQEWRILPGLSLLNDKSGQIVFLLIHLPIFYWLFWQLTNSPNTETFRVGFDIFLIFHLGLHILFLKHKNNKFKDWISWIIIAGAGMCGSFDLIIM